MVAWWVAVSIEEKCGGVMCVSVTFDGEAQIA